MNIYFLCVCVEVFLKTCGSYPRKIIKRQCIVKSLPKVLLYMYLRIARTLLIQGTLLLLKDTGVLRFLSKIIKHIDRYMTERYFWKLVAYGIKELT